METLGSILAEHPFLRDLDEKYLELITGCATNVRFQPDQYIFREGEAADQFYIIRTGRVALEIFTPGGAMNIGTYGQGDTVGWSWLIPPYRWHFDARALEEVRAIALDGKCLRGKCDDDHHLGYELMKRIARIMERRLQSTRIQLLDVYGAKR
jgi:CRP-like cAMP-binding protein